MAPAEVMSEIFRVLREMNIQWKKLGPYNLKCLCKIAAAAAASNAGWTSTSAAATTRWTRARARAAETGKDRGRPGAAEGDAGEVRDSGLQDEGRSVHDRLSEDGRRGDVVHGHGGGRVATAEARVGTENQSTRRRKYRTCT